MQTVQRLIVSNWLALVVNIVVHFVLGMAWYGVLATQWMDAIDATKRGFDPQAVSSAIYVIPIVVVILTTLFIAALMEHAGERSIAGGAKWGFLLWLAVTLPTQLLHYSFAGNPLSLTVIDGGVELVGLVLTGVVLGALGFRTRGVTRAAVSPAAA